jgi:hypothetical protein
MVNAQTMKLFVRKDNRLPVLSSKNSIRRSFSGYAFAEFVQD